MTLTDAEIWDGNVRLAEELRGGGDAGELLLGPINKGQVTLNSGRLTLSARAMVFTSGNAIWSYDTDSDNARFHITNQIR